jgi:hypothetical protein
MLARADLLGPLPVLQRLDAGLPLDELPAVLPDAAHALRLAAGAPYALEPAETGVAHDDVAGAVAETVYGPGAGTVAVVDNSASSSSSSSSSSSAVPPAPLYWSLPRAFFSPALALGARRLLLTLPLRRLVVGTAIAPCPLDTCVPVTSVPRFATASTVAPVEIDTDLHQHESSSSSASSPPASASTVIPDEITTTAPADVGKDMSSLAAAAALLPFQWRTNDQGVRVNWSWAARHATKKSLQLESLPVGSGPAITFACTRRTYSASSITLPVSPLLCVDHRAALKATVALAPLVWIDTDPVAAKALQRLTFGADQAAVTVSEDVYERLQRRKRAGIDKRAGGSVAKMALRKLSARSVAIYPHEIRALSAPEDGEGAGAAQTGAEAEEEEEKAESRARPRRRSRTIVTDIEHQPVAEDEGEGAGAGDADALRMAIPRVSSFISESVRQQAEEKLATRQAWRAVETSGSGDDDLEALETVEARDSDDDVVLVPGRRGQRDDEDYLPPLGTPQRKRPRALSAATQTKPKAGAGAKAPRAPRVKAEPRVKKEAAKKEVVKREPKVKAEKPARAPRGTKAAKSQDNSLRSAATGLLSDLQSLLGIAADPAPAPAEAPDRPKRKYVKREPRDPSASSAPAQRRTRVKAEPRVKSEAATGQAASRKRSRQADAGGDDVQPRRREYQQPAAPSTASATAASLLQRHGVHGVDALDMMIQRAKDRLKK